MLCCSILGRLTHILPRISFALPSLTRSYLVGSRFGLDSELVQKRTVNHHGFADTSRHSLLAVRGEPTSPGEPDETGQQAAKMVHILLMRHMKLELGPMKNTTKLGQAAAKRLKSSEPENQLRSAVPRTSLSGLGFHFDCDCEKGLGCGRFAKIVRYPANELFSILRSISIARLV